MSSSRLEILCSPSPSDNAFITWGSDLSLYFVEEFHQTSLQDDTDFEHKSGFFRLSERFFAYTVGRSKEFKFIKHVAWCPRSAGHHLPQMPPPIVAVGLASGQVVLTSFSRNQDSDINLGASSGAELAPKHQRQCNGLAFSGSDPTLLAAGFDRHRSDHAVVVWDASHAIASAANSSSSSVYLNASTGYGGGSGRALLEVGLSEQCNSLAWMCSQPKTLAAGMNGKHLKFYDLRDSLKQVQTSAPTKGVFGVCVDPFFDFRLASFAADNAVMIWDRRSYERPIYTIGEGPSATKSALSSSSSSSSQSSGAAISKLSWCPTRSGLLASCSKDSPMLKLYDIHADVSSKEGGVHNVLERFDWPGKPSASPILSFTWNAGPAAFRLLALTADGSIVDHEVAERVTVTWSPDSELVWAQNNKTIQVLSRRPADFKSGSSANAISLSASFPSAVRCDDLADDITYKMKKRATKKYGLQSSNLASNGGMVDDPELKSAWEWMESSQKLQKERYARGMLPPTSYWATIPASPTTPNFQRWTNKCQGVRWILCGESGRGIAQRSEAVDVPWIGLELGPRTVLARVYQSEPRSFCLRLCGWGFDRGGVSLNLFLDRLTAEHAYERAAAVAVFHLHVRRAMQILQQGGSRAGGGEGGGGGRRPLHLVAMALAGFTDDRNSLWRETCTKLKAELNEPYLSAIFTFLTSDPDKLEQVLEEGMAVRDNVAFALTFLPDAKLYDYVTRLTERLTDRGSLDGLLMTGLAVSVSTTSAAAAAAAQQQQGGSTATTGSSSSSTGGEQQLTVNTSVSGEAQGPASDPLLSTPTNQHQPTSASGAAASSSSSLLQQLQQGQLQMMTGVPVFNGTNAISSIALTSYTTTTSAVPSMTGAGGVLSNQSSGGSSITGATVILASGGQALSPVGGAVIASSNIASGLTLLQNYVDRTGDVQSAALMALHAEVLSDERANNWLRTYRSMLDSWGLWSERCLCDVEATKLDPSNKCPPQIYVCCTFCGKGISPSVVKSLGTQRNMYFRMQAQNQAAKSKLSSCPSCRKPLPRCSLCQVHLGTASGVADFLSSLQSGGGGGGGAGGSATSPTMPHPGSGRSPSKGDRRLDLDGSLGGADVSARKKLSPMDSWFTWCQSCRHGGHANHILKWFREHEDCPVTGCACKCLLLDSTGVGARNAIGKEFFGGDLPLTPETLVDGVTSAFAAQRISAAATQNI